MSCVSRRSVQHVPSVRYPDWAERSWGTESGEQGRSAEHGPGDSLGHGTDLVVLTVLGLKHAARVWESEEV